MVSTQRAAPNPPRVSLEYVRCRARLSTELGAMSRCAGMGPVCTRGGACPRVGYSLPYPPMRHARSPTGKTVAASIRGGALQPAGAIGYNRARSPTGKTVAPGWYTITHWENGGTTPGTREAIPAPSGQGQRFHGNLLGMVCISWQD